MSLSYYRSAWLFPRSRLRQPFPRRPRCAMVELFAPPAAPDITPELIASLRRNRRRVAATRARRPTAEVFAVWLLPQVPSSVTAELLVSSSRKRRREPAAKRRRVQAAPLAVWLLPSPPDVVLLTLRNRRGSRRADRPSPKGAQFPAWLYQLVPSGVTAELIASWARRRPRDAAPRARKRRGRHPEAVLGNPPVPLPPTDAGLLVVLTRAKVPRVVPWRKVVRRRFALETLWPGPVFTAYGPWRTWTMADAESKPAPVAMVHMRATTWRIFARLWDVTSGLEVAGSRLIADSAEWLWYASPYLVLVPGRRYRFELGAEPGSVGEVLAAEIAAAEAA